MERTRWLHAGRVGRPHGLDGSFHVIEPAPALLEEGAVLVIAGQTMRIIRRAGHERDMLLRLEGVDDRSGAEALRGAELLVERDAAPELPADEWWAEELEGCVVRDGGRPVGRVRRLVGLPSCEVLEVERAAGGDDLLVPLVRDAVREVDTGRREIDVDLRFLGED